MTNRRRGGPPRRRSPETRPESPQSRESTGERVALRVERMVAGGDALGRHHDGRVVFVRGALAGELVTAEVVRDRRDVVHAVAVEVSDPAPERVVEPCRHIGRGCGGCSWQYIAESAQLGFKVGIVSDALRRLGRLSTATVAAGASIPGAGLRTTLRLAVADDGRVGFRAARSHRVVAVEDCLVAHPALVALLPGLRARGVDELVLRVGVASGEIVAWSPTDPGASRPSGLPAAVTWGAAGHVHEVVAGHRLRVSAGSFFQSSPQAAEVLAALVGSAVDDAALGDHPWESGNGCSTDDGGVSGGRSCGGGSGDHGRIIDAFGGVGLFSAASVPPGQPVTLIEMAGSSVGDARVNLAGRPVTMVETMVEDWAPQPASVVIADPARRGLGRPAVAVLTATGCTRMVLVSCDAAALGRDAALLTEHGFVHRLSTVVDPFPHTPHVEVVTIFDRSTSK